MGKEQIEKLLPTQKIHDLRGSHRHFDQVKNSVSSWVTLDVGKASWATVTQR